MYKTLLLLLLPFAGLCQNKNLGTYYKCYSDGKVTQELTLLKNDSFYYQIKPGVKLLGIYRVSGDTLFLTSTKLPPDTPLIFRIKRRDLVAFSYYRIPPEWCLTKVR